VFYVSVDRKLRTVFPRTCKLKMWIIGLYRPRATRRRQEGTVPITTHWCD